ncbi:hypothetical protein GCM10025789_03430 [Tessaracoccus lubricantis]|uniref:Uncharacterized protein n=1 Tax=Tessaracoccus lubricantis TaxID=545543 RepID=A0ABP9F0W2_9ACTN
MQQTGRSPRFANAFPTLTPPFTGHIRPIKRPSTAPQGAAGAADRSQSLGSRVRIERDIGSSFAMLRVGEHAGNKQVLTVLVYLRS